MHDLVIRGAIVLDGLGHDRSRVDATGRVCVAGTPLPLSMIVCTRRAGPRRTLPNSASTRLASPSRAIALARTWRR